MDIKYYNVTMWEKLGLVYWGITKCGCTSVKSHLYFFERGEKKESLDIHKKKYLKYVDPIYQEGFVNFATIRNPTDRFLSMYNDLLKTRPVRGRVAKINVNWTLDEFALFLSNSKDEELDVHFKSQSFFLRDERIYKIRIENIKEEWNLNIPPPEKIINKSNNHSGYKDLSDKTLDLITKRYCIDYKMWKS